MNIFLVILMYAAWSNIFSIGKAALQYSPPLFLTGFRMTFAGIVLLAYLFVFKRSFQKINLTQWLSLGLLGFFSIYLTNILEFWGLQYLTASKTCFIYSLSPFFAAFFSYLHFNEKMNPRKWAGLVIGFIGVIPVLLTQVGSEGMFQAFSIFSWPTLAIVGAALSSVYGWVLLRLVVKKETITPPFANGVSMLFGGVLALGHSFCVDSWTPIPVITEHLGGFLQTTILMTLISNILCYNLYGMLLKRYTATFLSFIGLLSPLFASISSWALLAEPISWTILLSTGIVSIGLWIVYQAELKQGYILKNQQPVKN